MSDSSTIEELLLTADILRSMLDESENANRLLKEHIRELENALRKHGIPIPDYDVRHSDLPIA